MDNLLPVIEEYQEFVRNQYQQIQEQKQEDYEIKTFQIPLSFLMMNLKDIEKEVKQLNFEQFDSIQSSKNTKIQVNQHFQFFSKNIFIPKIENSIQNQEKNQKKDIFIYIGQNFRDIYHDQEQILVFLDEVEATTPDEKTEILIQQIFTKILNTIFKKNQQNQNKNQQQQKQDIKQQNENQQIQNQKSTKNNDNNNGNINIEQKQKQKTQENGNQNQSLGNIYLHLSMYKYEKVEIAYRTITNWLSCINQIDQNFDNLIIYYNNDEQCQQ
ncbi:hypothetical protein PPERSA_04574 [Pseudocohnilembus persalinus]|uniref:Uncharacterized protein n=1 Tax=Pseudocohnilembus persalinus TaxID=266149 RepID=A0A0V0QE99_PSEPJ|nr:hypothetical protein PPERSA_04574 [Pseudocohnilembus persalinus]|eukprot:KRX00553.1 hypothetical protein PPERSA_04574 [Pseudocohnilembus persalinus]